MLSKEIKDVNNITLYDLMAEDLCVWIQRNKRFGFDLVIEGDDPTERIEIKGVHSAAMHTFSDFCSRFLHFFNKLQDQEMEELNKQVVKLKSVAN